MPYLLTGTVRWEKGPKRSRVRVSPELIDASTGITRWAHPFDAAFTDVFAVQSDIASQVAGALHLALTDSARAQLSAVPTRNLDAYAHYLRSREMRTGEYTPDVLRAAIAELREAVRLDTVFVAAWADLAQAQMDVFRLGGLMVNDADSARASLRRAEALAPASPDVRAASGRYHLVVEGDFAEALRDYREALRAQPHRSDLLIVRGHGGDGARALAGGGGGPGARDPASIPARPTPPPGSASRICASIATTSRAARWTAREPSGPPA